MNHLGKFRRRGQPDIPETASSPGRIKARVMHFLINN